MCWTIGTISNFLLNIVHPTPTYTINHNVLSWEKASKGNVKLVYITVVTAWSVRQTSKVRVNFETHWVFHRYNKTASLIAHSF